MVSKRHGCKTEALSNLEYLNHYQHFKKSESSCCSQSSWSKTKQHVLRFLVLTDYKQLQIFPWRICFVYKNKSTDFITTHILVKIELGDPHDHININIKENMGKLVTVKHWFKFSKYQK